MCYSASIRALLTCGLESSTSHFFSFTNFLAKTLKLSFFSSPLMVYRCTNSKLRICMVMSILLSSAVDGK